MASADAVPGAGPAFALRASARQAPLLLPQRLRRRSWPPL